MQPLPDFAVPAPLRPGSRIVAQQRAEQRKHTADGGCYERARKRQARHRGVVRSVAVTRCAATPGTCRIATGASIPADMAELSHVLPQTGRNVADALARVTPATTRERSSDCGSALRWCSPISCHITAHSSRPAGSTCRPGMKGTVRPPVSLEFCPCQVGPLSCITPGSGHFGSHAGRPIKPCWRCSSRSASGGTSLASPTIATRGPSRRVLRTRDSGYRPLQLPSVDRTRADGVVRAGAGVHGGSLRHIAL